MPYSERYRPPGGFSSGHKSYDNPNEKKPPTWKIFLMVLAVMITATALFVGFFYFGSLVFK